MTNTTGSTHDTMIVVHDKYTFFDITEQLNKEIELGLGIGPAG